MATCAQIIIPATSGLLEDSAVNNLSFVITPQGTDTVEDVINREDPGGGTEWGIQESIEAFYNGIRVNLSNQMDEEGWIVKYTETTDPKPIFPFLETGFDLAGLGVGTLPTEVALCLSFQGARLSGVPQARRRGRIYIGPLATNAAGVNRPSEGIVTNLIGSANLLLGRSDAVPDWEWVVYSPTSQLSTTITNGWVDDAFDTQRSRGVAPTSRTTFS